MRAGAPGFGRCQGAKRIRRENTLRPSQQETEQDGGNFLHVARPSRQRLLFRGLLFGLLDLLHELFRILVEILFAILADPPNQALGLNEVNAGGHEEWFDSHIHEPRDG